MRSCLVTLALFVFGNVKEKELFLPCLAIHHVCQWWKYIYRREGNSAWKGLRLGIISNTHLFQGQNSSPFNN